MKKHIVYVVIVIVILVASFSASVLIFREAEDVPSVTSLPEKIVVFDDMGRAVEVSHPVDSVVSLASSISEVICAIGASDVLVAVDQHSTFPPYLQERINVGSGSTPNVELILAQEPDVVFAWHYCRVIEELESQGVPVYVINPTSVDEILNEIRNIGEMLSDEEGAEKLTEFMVGYFETVESRTNVLEEKEKPKVYIEGKDDFKTVSNGTFSQIVATCAGGINIAGEEPVRYPILASEYIIAENPDVIVKFDYAPIPSQMTAEELREQIVSRPGWSQIDAVKNDKVYILHYSELSVNPRLVIGLLKLSKWFHPDLFSDIDISAVQMQMYKEIYGIEDIVYEN
jgi:iron complex transport system substrate-binding protein